MAVGTPTYGALALDTSSPLTATAPTRNVGDKLVCAVFIRGSTTSSPSITTPSGWTLVGSIDYHTTGAGRGFAVYERIADGTATDDFSAAFSMAGIGYVFSAVIVAFPGGGTVTLGTTHHVDSVVQNVAFGVDATLPADGAVLALANKTDDCTSIAALSGTGPTFTNISWIDDSARDDLTFSLDYALGTGSSVALGTARTMTVSGGTTDYTSAVYVIVEASATTTSYPIAAAIAGAASLAAGIGANRPLGAAPAGAASLAAGIGANRPIGAAPAGTSSIVASIGETAAAGFPIAAVLAASASLAAQLGRSAPIGSTVSGLGVLTSDLAASRPLAATLAGGGSLAGLVGANRPILAAIAGAGSVSAAITKSQPLAAALAGEALTAASIGAQRPQAAALAGDATLAGVLASIRPLAASLAGASGVLAEIGTTAELPTGGDHVLRRRRRR